MAGSMSMQERMRRQMHASADGRARGHGSEGSGSAFPSTARAGSEAGIAHGGASTGTTGAGAAPGFVTVPAEYVQSLEGQVEALKDEIKGMREDRVRMANALATLERLAPVIERIAESDPATAAALQATVGPIPRGVSIISPERPVGLEDMDEASLGVGPEAAAGPPPPRTVSDVRIWTGTWNLGTADPFARLDVDKNPDVVERVLGPLVPRDYDIYVLGVQEAVSDRIFRAVARFTGCYQLPLHAKLEPAKESGDKGGVRSRRMGRAICVQEFIDEARQGRHPQRASSMTDMLDRVFGRGDGALIRPKFTGIAVFVTPSAAPYVRLLGVYKHSFGASEGSKGGVGVALGVYDSTMAFVTAHMASKRLDMRRQQYCDLVERLGAKLGGRGFHMTEEFHHVVWMGDLNYHCAGCSAEEAAAHIRQGRVADLLLDHDELIRERAAGTAFFDFEEPNMVPDFYPTYKRRKGRGAVDMGGGDPDWVDKVYELEFREAAIKGGRTVERVPSWTDRIMFRSLPSRADNLLPESLDPDDPDAPHNYRCVNYGCDVSDHAPVFCTWTLRIRLDPVDETLPEGTSEGDPGLPPCVIGRGTLGVDASLLHPALRPLHVILTVTNIRVNYRRAMRSPRALSMLFPLPYEDGDLIPERAKIVRTGTLMSMSARSDSKEGLAGSTAHVLSRANKLPDMHLLLKVSLEDNTKAQAVISLKDVGITDVGRITVTRFAPLMRNGLRAMLKDDGGAIDMEYTLEYHGHYDTAGLDLSAGGGAAPASAAASAAPTPRSVAAERLQQISAAILEPTPAKRPAAPPASAAGQGWHPAAAAAAAAAAAPSGSGWDGGPSPRSMGADLDAAAAGTPAGYRHDDAASAGYRHDDAAPESAWTAAPAPAPPSVSDESRSRPASSAYGAPRVPFAGGAPGAAPSARYPARQAAAAPSPYGRPTFAASPAPQPYAAPAPAATPAWAGGAQPAAYDEDDDEVMIEDDE